MSYGTYKRYCALKLAAISGTVESKLLLFAFMPIATPSLISQASYPEQASGPFWTFTSSIADPREPVFALKWIACRFASSFL
ncbi:MAG: hypothetical protein AAB897_04185 [Patescibacteria group bacterium]